MGTLNNLAHNLVTFYLLSDLRFSLGSSSWASSSIHGSHRTSNSPKPTEMNNITAIAMDDIQNDITLTKQLCLSEGDRDFDT